MNRGGSPVRLSVKLDDYKVLPVVFGPHNTNLEQMEKSLNVSLSALGDTVTIIGDGAGVAMAKSALQMLMTRARTGVVLDRGDIDAAVRMARDGDEEGMPETLVLRTRKRRVFPRTPTQADYICAMRERDLVFGFGPAGTGKTYLAVAMAVAMKMKGEVDRIILSRPAVEAGERLGFLPGDMREKVDPYLRPLYDALQDMLPGDVVTRAMENQEIEVAPLAFMRGRTLSNAFIILDEAQNTTPVQMKMFLTRLGGNSRMVVTGDLSQIDLPPGIKSGLHDALDILSGVAEIGFVRFGKGDVLRHDLVTRIVSAYDAQGQPDYQEKPGKREKEP